MMNDFEYRFQRLEKIIETLMVLLPDDYFNLLRKELSEMSHRRNINLEGFKNEN